MTGQPFYLRWGLPGVTVVSLVIACVSAGPARLVGGLILLGCFAWAGWIALPARFTAIGPAIGLTLAGLVLAGLVLAALRILDTVPTALVIAGLTLLTRWAGSRYLAAEVPEAEVPEARVPEPGPRVSPAALAGGLIFLVAAIVAVRYSAVSAASGSARAVSPAAWAYSSGGRLHIGVREPAGQPPALLRIAVVQGGITTAAWNDVRLAGGQTWLAPSLPMTANAPVRVLIRRGRVIVASFPVTSPG